MKVFKHKTGLSVELICIANEKATDKREVQAVYKVLLSGEFFTENLNTFYKEFDPIDTMSIDEQLDGIDFIA